MPGDFVMVSVRSVVGKGTYGTVHLGVAQRNRGDEPTDVAVKIFRLPIEDLAIAWREIATLRALRDSTHIVRMLDYNATCVAGEPEVNIVMEQCRTATLDAALRSGTFAEHPPVLRDVARQIVMGVRDMHMQRIVHLDIKPQNILFATGDGRVRLCDFGLARKVFGPLWRDEGSWGKFCPSRGYLTTMVVTAWYRPPELWLPTTRRYDPFAVDVWSVGMVILAMANARHYLHGAADKVSECLPKIDALVGTPSWLPKGGWLTSRTKKRKNVKRTPERFNEHVSATDARLRKLLFQMLNPNPEERPSIDEVARNPYFSSLLQSSAESLEGRRGSSPRGRTPPHEEHEAGRERDDHGDGEEYAQEEAPAPGEALLADAGGDGGRVTRSSGAAAVGAVSGGSGR